MYVQTQNGIAAHPVVPESAVILAGVSRSFGPVRALSEASLTIAYGEKIGLVGHNGAGKSTMMNVLSGVLQPDAGTISIGGKSYEGVKASQTHALGIRCIFQELSLCPNLTAVENTLIRQGQIAGFGWRKRAQTLIAQSLDRIFPGHDIDIFRPIGNLAIAQRQMVEIAEAFAGPASDIKLVILDEPTSSLGTKVADQLMAFLDVASNDGIATILISHRLNEILLHTERAVVMVDGRIVGAAPTADLTRQKLVSMMGHLETPSVFKAAAEMSAATEPIVLTSEGDDNDGLRLVVRRGEIVGFAGLDGHGQTRTLQQIFVAATKGQAGMQKGSVAYVAGDRQTEGVFTSWSVSENASIRALRDISSYGIIDLARERAIVTDWFKRIGVRTAGTDAAIGTLSGGNQQKILFARALASSAPLILLDDPMRGVDVGTKSEVYALIRAEAHGGRSFVWYSTETEELRNCDRVYVFREGEIVAVLDASEITEENILSASFADLANREASHV